MLCTCSIPSFLSCFPTGVLSWGMTLGVGGRWGRGTTCIVGKPALVHNSQKSTSKFPVGV